MGGPEHTTRFPRHSRHLLELPPKSNAAPARRLVFLPIVYAVARSALKTGNHSTFITTELTAEPDARGAVELSFKLDEHGLLGGLPRLLHLAAAYMFSGISLPSSSRGHGAHDT